MNKNSYPSVIIGTAGHIDHGKTELIKQITGIDTDRLIEEKQRGMSIDIGFAPLVFSSGKIVGVIDVPGHEKFVKNMMVGASGIDIGLLVIAADDGIMPQTIEHFDILRLLNINKLLVVITKMDLVDEETVDIVESEIKELLKNSPYRDAAIVRTSSKTREGIEEVVKELEKLTSLKFTKDINLPIRLPIDRVFTLSGIGTVITGTLWSGKVKSGDEIEILPNKIRCRIRNVQVFNEDVKEALAGQRVALNLIGVKKNQLSRGDVVLKPGYLTPTSLLDTHIEILSNQKSSLKSGRKVSLHHGTREIIAKASLLGVGEIKPGETGYVRFKLDYPLVVKNYDKFIIRNSSLLRTMGGGLILLSHPSKKRIKREKIIDKLNILYAGNKDEIISLWLKENYPEPLTTGEISKKSEISVEEVEDVIKKLLHLNKVINMSTGVSISDKPQYLLLTDFQRLRQEMLSYLEEYHLENILKIGIDTEILRKKIFFTIPKTKYETLLQKFQQDKIIIKEGSKILSPLISYELSGKEKQNYLLVKNSIVSGKFSPPDVKELSKNINLSIEEVNQILNILKREKKVIKLKDGLFFATESFEKAKDKLIETINKNRKITLAKFRDVLKTSRKYSEALLEYFDKEGLTKRVEDYRILKKND
ncbi:MAG: selenocysteine-specific translation elongation factor [Actinobacteria bacterium]|nr:selenocysteine-specific translation elongation factor [Actinomycetota bacterium]